MGPALVRLLTPASRLLLPLLLLLLLLVVVLGLLMLSPVRDNLKESKLLFAVLSLYDWARSLKLRFAVNLHTQREGGWDSNHWIKDKESIWICVFQELMLDQISILLLFCFAKDLKKFQYPIESYAMETDKLSSKKVNYFSSLVCNYRMSIQPLEQQF